KRSASVPPGEPVRERPAGCSREQTAGLSPPLPGPLLPRRLRPATLTTGGPALLQGTFRGLPRGGVGCCPPVPSGGAATRPATSAAGRRSPRPGGASPGRRTSSPPWPRRIRPPSCPAHFRGGSSALPPEDGPLPASRFLLGARSSGE